MNKIFKSKKEKRSFCEKLISYNYKKNKNVLNIYNLLKLNDIELINFWNNVGGL